MGDIFREMLKEDSELGRKVKSYVEKGMLVPDYIVNEVVKQRIARVLPSKGFILDGYPRTVEQADTLDSITEIDVVILLMVPDRIIIERLSSRRICRNCGTVYNIRFLKPRVEGVCDKCGGELYQRSDDTPEVIKNRLQVYEAQTQPILQKFREKNIPFVVAVCDKLEMPPENVVEQIVRDLERLKLA
jgi:adenylate kinase